MNPLQKESGYVQALCSILARVRSTTESNIVFLKRASAPKYSGFGLDFSAQRWVNFMVETRLKGSR